MRRLLLFEIDGTLFWGGPAKLAFHEAMLATFGTAGDIESFSFSGKTDPQIARGLLRGVGMADGDIDAGLPTLWGHYLAKLEDRLTGHPVDVLPGVPRLLEALAAEDDVALALLTGNIVDGARLKLGSAGLTGYFATGSYGSDHEVRDELPAVALRRARETWGVDFHPREVMVVGDTPRDVACGKVAGLMTVAVATGHYGAESLRATGADHVLESFDDIDATLAVLVA